MDQSMGKLSSDAGTARRRQGARATTSKDTIESAELKLKDHKAHYLKAGSGPAVVLFHGGASDCRDWTETMTFLSHSFSLYAPDMLGYGHSTGQNGQNGQNNAYYLSDFVSHAVQFVQALDSESLVLVGHSLGGRVCLEIALSHPTMVSRLVLIDTVGFGKLSPVGTTLGASAWAVRGVLRRPQPYPRFLKEKDEEKDWSCLERLPALKVPTLIVWNRYDPYYSVSGALKAKELIPDARLEVIPGYGHAPHVRKRDLFNSLLLNFIDHR